MDINTENGTLEACLLRSERVYSVHPKTLNSRCEEMGRGISVMLGMREGENSKVETVLKIPLQESSLLQDLHLIDSGLTGQNTGHLRFARADS